MASPTRINIRHSYLCIPRREEVRLLNLDSTVIGFIADASYSDVSFSDAPVVVNCQNETRTWKSDQNSHGKHIVGSPQSQSSVG
jgi:hypothetical protein